MLWPLCPVKHVIFLVLAKIKQVCGVGGCASRKKKSDPPSIVHKNGGAISGNTTWKSYDFYHTRFYQKSDLTELENARKLSKMGG